MVPSSPDSPHANERDSGEADSIEFEFSSAEEKRDVPRGEVARERAGSPPSEPDDSSRIEPSGARGSRRPGWLTGLLLLPCLAGLLWLMLPVAFRIEAGLKYPYQLDAEEGFVYKQALDLNEGRSIYSPIDEEPYLVGNYPPLYPALTALALKTGVQGLAAGRWVVLVASALIAVLLVAGAYAVSRNAMAALLAPLLFLVSYEFYTWSPYARVDLPALAFTMGGIAAFVFSPARAGLVLSAVCFVAAAFTRQTAILAPAALVLALFATDRRRLLWFLIPYLGLGLGLLVLLNIVLKGEFWNHLVVYNRNEMDWNVLRSVLKNEIWFFYRWWILGLAGGSLAAAVGSVLSSRRSENGHRESAGRRRHAVFFPIYFILSAFSLSAFAKSGSAANYALEPLAAASLFFAFVLGRSLGHWRRGAAGARWAGLLGVLLISCGLWVHVVRMLPVSWSGIFPERGAIQKAGKWMDERRVGWALFSSRNPDAEEVVRGDRMVALMRATPGEVLSELPVFAIAAEKDVVFQPFIMTTLAREGQWNEEPFIEDLRAKRFELILTTQDLRAAGEGAVLARYTDSMAGAIVEHYELTGVAPPGSSGIPYFLWKPAGS